MIGGLGQHDAKIEDPEAGRYGDVKKLFKDQRRNIHAAGGCAATQNKTQAQSQTHTAKQHIQQQLIRYHHITHGTVQQFQQYRI